MDESTQEAVGFLARWCLLALTAALAAGFVWLAGAGILPLGTNLSAGLVLPDMIGRGDASKTPNLTGHTDVAGSRQEALMAVQIDGRLRILGCYEGRFYPVILQPHAGVNPIVVTGLPYGPLAFRRQRATLTVVPGATTVYLLDARWVLSALQADGESARQTLSLCARRGAVSLFHPGPLEAFVALRAGLRQAAVDLPILCETDLRAPAMETLWHAAATLRAGPIVVVTADEVLARAAAADKKGRYLVHLLSDRPEAASGRLIVHSSLANLKEYLAAQPIPR